MNIVAVLSALHITVAQLEFSKWAIAALYVIATAFVVLGVYWEAERFPKKKQQFGWKVLVIALAVETLSGGLVMALDGVIGEVRSDETILAYDQAGRANKALRDILSPRNLSSDGRGRVAKKICPLGPQPFTYAVSPLMEADSDLPRQLGILLLTDCKWRMYHLPHGTLTLGGVPDIALTFGSGVVISYFGPNQTFKSVAETLASALGDEGVASRAAPFDGSNVSDNKKVISVAVGAKPLFLRELPGY